MNHSVICLLGIIFMSILVTDGFELYVENDVLVITDDNFESAVGQYKYCLIKFYAPWCAHCQSFAPEFNKAARILKDIDSPARLAKVDATKYPELAERFQVRGFPTLKFVRHHKTYDYYGGRYADEIVTWLRRKLDHPVYHLESVPATRAALAKHEVTFIGFFRDTSSESARAYLEVAADTEDNVFYISGTPSVLAEYKIAQDALTVFKRSDEERTDLTGGLDANNMKEFVTKHRLPLVMEYTQELSHQIFGANVKSHVLLFVSKQSPKLSHYSAVFRALAREFKEKVLFVYVNIDEEDNAGLLEFFDVKVKDCPTYRYINTENEMMKYRPGHTDSLTQSGVKLFVQDILDGKRKPMLKSEEIPDDWDSRPVKILVGKNFEQVARDKSKNVFVKFYAPWCGHCKQLEPVWESLAERFADDSDIVVAQMDYTVNKLGDVRVQEIPTVKLFSRGSNEIIDYTGKMTEEGLARFIESRGLIQDGEVQRDEL